MTVIVCLFSTEAQNSAPERVSSLSEGSEFMVELSGRTHTADVVNLTKHYETNRLRHKNKGQQVNPVELHSHTYRLAQHFNLPLIDEFLLFSSPAVTPGGTCTLTHKHGCNFKLSHCVDRSMG